MLVKLQCKDACLTWPNARMLIIEVCVSPHPRYCPSQNSVLHQWSQLPVSYWSAEEQTIFAAGKGYWWLDPPQTLQTPSWNMPKEMKKKIILINTSILEKYYEYFHKNPDFLLVERISEFWSHEQCLQKAVEITGHSLVDQTNITWLRAKDRKLLQVH